MESGCNDGDVRLMEGGSELEGRVEICWNGVWGAVVNRKWTFQEAKIICTQLGYSSECEYSSSQYNFVMRSYHLNTVLCKCL